MIRRRALLASVALVHAAALVACAKPDPDENVSSFVPPTSLSRADYATSLDRRFARLDRNMDGEIQPEEVRRRPERIAALDADGDGGVSRTEFFAGRLARFDQADVNKDGTLTGDERRAAGLFANDDAATVKTGS